MWRFLFIAFFLAHAGIHAAIWVTPAAKAPNAPFNAGHSWLLGDQRVLALVLARPGGGGIPDAGRDRAVGARRMVAAHRGDRAGGLVRADGRVLHPWFLFIQTVNAALIVGILWLDWPSKQMVGA